MKNSIKSGVLLWISLVMLILNAIGSIATLEILSGVVLWIAKHWSGLIHWPFARLSELIEYDIPKHVSHGLATMAAYMGVARAAGTTMLDQIGAEDRKQKIYDIRIERQIAAAGLTFTSFIFVLGAVGNSFGANDLKAWLAVATAFLVIIALTQRKPYSSKRMKEALLVAMMRGLEIFGVRFWVGFLIIFLIGAWPWILAEATSIAECFVASVEGRTCTGAIE